MPERNYVLVGWQFGEPNYATRFASVEQALAYAKSSDYSDDYRVFEATLVAFGPGHCTFDYDGTDYDGTGESNV